MRSGPALVGYDGSPAAKRALQEAIDLLGPVPMLVVVIWEAGLPFDLVAAPTIDPAPIDIRAALELDQQLYDRARRWAEQAAADACELGRTADGLVVADEMTPADTLIRLAAERDAAVIVVGRHGHRAVSEALVGSTTRELIRLTTASSTPWPWAIWGICSPSSTPTNRPPHASNRVFAAPSRDGQMGGSSLT